MRLLASSVLAGLVLSAHALPSSSPVVTALPAQPTSALGYFSIALPLEYGLYGSSGGVGNVAIGDSASSRDTSSLTCFFDGATIDCHGNVPNTWTISPLSVGIDKIGTFNAEHYVRYDTYKISSTKNSTGPAYRLRSTTFSYNVTGDGTGQTRVVNSPAKEVPADRDTQKFFDNVPGLGPQI